MVYYGQGTDGDPNPYIPQSGLLSGLLASQKVDFVVLRMDIASLGPRHIAVTDAAAKDASGTVLARFYSEQDFLSMLKSYALDEQGFDSLKLRVEQSYMPDGGAQVKAGKRSYAVVLVGRHPLPKSLSVEADVDVEPGEPRVFHLQWAD